MIPRLWRILLVLAVFVASSRYIEAQTPHATIVGAVHDSLGAGIADAEVILTGAAPARVARTGPIGDFVLPEVPAGTAKLTIRRLGFRPADATVNVGRSETTSVRVVLAPIARRLAPVVAIAQTEISNARLSGFNARVARGGGHFITRAQIDRLSNTSLVDALRRIGGVRVIAVRGGHSVLLGGATCPPTVFVDGFASTVDVIDLDILDLRSVEGVEVYAGGLSAPPELLPLAGRERCGVVAVWSRPFRSRPAVATSSINVDSLLSAKAILTESEVDVPAAYEPHSAEPVYPEEQLRRGVAGRVFLEFVVDSRGVVEAGTIRVVTASDSAFGRAAMSAIAHAVFRPALLRGRPVSQLVQLPFEFEPGASAGAAESKRPDEFAIERFLATKI